MVFLIFLLEARYSAFSGRSCLCSPLTNADYPLIQQLDSLPSFPPGLCVIEPFLMQTKYRQASLGSLENQRYFTSPLYGPVSLGHCKEFFGILVSGLFWKKSIFLSTGEFSILFWFFLLSKSWVWSRSYSMFTYLLRHEILLVIPEIRIVFVTNHGWFLQCLKES